LDPDVPFDDLAGEVSGDEPGRQRRDRREVGQGRELVAHQGALVGSCLSGWGAKRRMTSRSSPVTVTRRVVLCMSPPSSGDLLPRLRYKRTGHRRRTPEEDVPDEEMATVKAVTAG
jgi:hypothetical protein